MQEKEKHQKRVPLPQTFKMATVLSCHPPLHPVPAATDSLVFPSLGGHPGKTTRLHFSLCAGADRQGERKLLRLLSYNIGVNGPINWLGVAGGGRAKWGLRVGWLTGWLCGLGGGRGRRGPRQRREIKYDSGKCNNVPLGYTGGQFLGLLE